MPPVLPTERIAHLATAGDYCAAGFRSDLCRRRVMSAPDDPGDPAAYVRFALIATELPCRSNPPLRARSGHEQMQQKQCAYSITSSARASRVGGISRPSALAVLRLMTSSYLVGAWTGRSAGFSPLRMRST